MKKVYNTHRYGIWIDQAKAVVLYVDVKGTWVVYTV